MTSPANTNPATATSPGFCAACGAALALGARFCHRCGTPAGQAAPAITGPAAAPNAVAAILPWGVAFVALLALVSFFAANNFGKAKGSAVDGSSNAIANAAIDGQGAPPTADANRAPDISSMSPSDRAAKLYIRVMTYAENNKMDSALFFGTNMAIPAHQMIENPSNDERFHLARLAEITGDSTLARAQVDTILQTEPNSLLGLLMGTRAARMNNNKAKAATYDKQLLKVLSSELAKSNPEYQVHRSEIDRAAEEARKGN